MAIENSLWFWDLDEHGDGWWGWVERIRMAVWTCILYNKWTALYWRCDHCTAWCIAWQIDISSEEYRISIGCPCHCFSMDCSFISNLCFGPLFDLPVAGQFLLQLSRWTATSSNTRWTLTSREVGKDSFPFLALEFDLNRLFKLLGGVGANTVGLGGATSSPVP